MSIEFETLVSRGWFVTNTKFQLCKTSFFGTRSCPWGLRGQQLKI